MNDIEALYTFMKTIWVLISLGTLGLIGRYFYVMSQAGDQLFKKKLSLNFSVALAVVYLAIFIKQLINYAQSQSDYFLYIAVGFMLMTVYMVIQCTNELSLHDNGLNFNMKYTTWSDVTGYQLANKEATKVFKVTANKKNLLGQRVKKNYIFSVGEQQGTEVARILKEKVG